MFWLNFEKKKRIFLYGQSPTHVESDKLKTFEAITFYDIDDRQIKVGEELDQLMNYLREHAMKNLGPS